MTPAFKPIRLAVSHGPDLHFDGKLVGEYSTQRKDGTKDRWTELRLWETPAGNWVAEMVGCSTRENEGEIREARVIDTFPHFYGDGTENQGWINAAMDLWRWTSAAKAFARELGWSVVQIVP